MPRRYIVKDEKALKFALLEAQRRRQEYETSRNNHLIR